jgi:hypothetical protein
MNKDLKKELLKYSGAAAALLGTGQVQAQYQYTDIPDTTVDYNNGFYNLDIDQDGQMDFTLTQYVDTGASGNTNAVLIQPYTNTINRVAGDRENNLNYPLNLVAATVIDASTNWEGVGGQFTTGYMAFEVGGTTYPNSNWIGPVENGFLGLELRKNGLPYYGWARLDIGEDSKSFTVKDFSINLTVDSAHVAGAELLSEIENLLERVKILVDDERISVVRHQANAPMTIRLIDLSGQLLRELSITDQEGTVDIAELPPAIYVLELYQDDMIRREKLLIH